MKKNVGEGGCFSFTLSGYVIASLFDVIVSSILAQLGGRRSAEREVKASSPGRTKIRGLQKTEKKVLPL